MSILSEEQQTFLANPFYSALTTRQSAYAQHIGKTVRYRPEVLPFAAVPTPDTAVDATALCSDTDANFIGVLPRIEADIPVAFRGACLQMIYPGNSSGNSPVPEPLPNEVELGGAEAREMVELTGVAFPGYFRPETYRLGRYIGLRVEGQLVAMAGHRTRMPGLREISGVCTRPGHTGRGYAQHLLRRLVDAPSGELPYLHVVSTNARAIAIYNALGFVTTGEVAFLKLAQTEPQPQVVPTFSELKKRK